MLVSPDLLHIRSFSSLSLVAKIDVSGDMAPALHEIYGVDTSLVVVTKVGVPTTIWLSCSPRNESMSRLQAMHEIRMTVLTRSCE